MCLCGIIRPWKINTAAWFLRELYSESTLLPHVILDKVTSLLLSLDLLCGETLLEMNEQKWTKYIIQQIPDAVIQCKKSAIDDIHKQILVEELVDKVMKEINAIQQTIDKAFGV